MAKEYIEREAMIQRLQNTPLFSNFATGGIFLRDGVIDLVERQSAADVVEVVHGEWIEGGYNEVPCVCSCCGCEAHYTSTFEEKFDYDWEENLQSTGYEEIREYIRTPYCPNCGTKMDGGKEE